MTIVLISLIAIILLYFFIAILPVKICAICGAISLVWLGLLIGLFFGWHNEILWTGIIMGGSVVGLMYKLENYFKKAKLANFWLIRILIIVLGFLSVYLLLKQYWIFFILTLLISVVLMVLSLLFIKLKPSFYKKISVFDGKTNKKFKKRLDNLVQQLEDCCD